MMPLECFCFCFILWAASQAQPPLVVSQPSSAEGTEGSSVTLHCSYNSTSEPKVGSFRWVKEPGVEVRKTTREFMGRVSPTSEQGFLLESRADIEIRDLRHYDSGVYRCVVKIPGFQETSGNGTELRVVKKDPKDPKKPAENSTHSIPLWAGLSSALAAFVASPLIVLYCRNRQGRRQARGSGIKRLSQDKKAESMADLNYSELVVKTAGKSKSQREKVTYASICV
nr:uncharacterized protein LOC118081048 isoform X2 [Zootoca vivipara]